jgi:hypothetical protein
MLHLAISTLGALHLEAGRPHMAFTIGLVEPFSWPSEWNQLHEVLVGDAFRAAATVPATVPHAAVPRVASAAITRARPRER